MTTPRVWLYQRLTTFTPLTNLIGGSANPRVFAKKTMTSNREDHPFIVYKMGFAANEELAEAMPNNQDVYRQFAQVWVYDYQDDRTADYMRIDEVLGWVKTAVHNQGSSAHGVITAKYIETSQDLNDETLNAVVKYGRILMTTKEK